MTNTTTTTELDLTDDWGIEDDDPTEALRTAIADAERKLHELRMTLLAPDVEDRIAASYVLTDISDDLMNLRFSIELGLGR